MARSTTSPDRPLARPISRRTCHMLLDGKKLLLTGVLDDRSIAFAVARLAQEQGAEVVLTGFGSGIRLTRRVAARLPQPPDVLELDVTDEAHIAAVAKDARRALGEGRRGPPRGRVRPAVVPRRRLPRRPLGGRRDRRPRLDLLARGARARVRAAAGGGRPRLDRGPRLRRLRGLARLRLDGCRQGGARVRHPLPRPRPRPAGHAREPGRRRPAAHDGGAVDRWLRWVRRRLVRARTAGLGPARPRARRPRRLRAAVGLDARYHRRDRPRRRWRPRRRRGHAAAT